MGQLTIPAPAVASARIPIEAYVSAETLKAADVFTVGFLDLVQALRDQGGVDTVAGEEREAGLEEVELLNVAVRAAKGLCRRTDFAPDDRLR